MAAHELNYRELKPLNRPVMRAYVAVMLWFLGRAVQSAARFDKAVQRDFAQLEEHFSFSLEVMPGGPAMVVKKGEGGTIRYMGLRSKRTLPDLRLKIKHLAAAFQLLTFQESTPTANASYRIQVDGDPAVGCIAVRILDRVQVLLLPGPIARLAVKRYPRIPLLAKWSARSKLYIGMLWG